MPAPFRLFRRLWRHHPMALGVFLAAFVLVLFFALRMTVFALHWSDPAQRAVQPQPWMTPGYVAHSWHLPKEEVFTLLALDPPPDRRMTLEEIARTKGVPLHQLLDELNVALQARAPR
ncbi:hypothetical protein ACX9MO_00065 [Pseudooceanicola sp. 502str34]